MVPSKKQSAERCVVDQALAQGSRPRGCNSIVAEVELEKGLVALKRWSERNNPVVTKVIRAGVRVTDGW